jgi:hypothetical protein
LLTVNVYLAGVPLAPDLRRGPCDTGRYGNFRPLIGDFLTEDDERLARRKAQIGEDEWLRTEQFARQLLEKGVPPRDGRPFHCLDAAGAVRG